MQDKKMDSFQQLGLTATASTSEVKKAYRRLVAQWHPDRYLQDSEQQRQAQERLKEINGAYAACLAQIASRRGERKAVAVGPVNKPARPPQPSPPVQSEPTAPSRAATLPQWPNLVLAALLGVGWLIGIRRHGLGSEFLQFLALLTIVPVIASFWYNARLLRGRLMLVLYLLALAGAGLFLLVNQALHEQQYLATVPSWQGSTSVEGGWGQRGGFGRDGSYSLNPSGAAERGFGPAAPAVVAPAAPMAPTAPTMPAAPLVPAPRSH
jgi:hypothetical protein